MDVVAQMAEALATARRRARLTQQDLGRLSGVHATEVSRIERGQRDVRISTVARLAAPLRSTPGQLLDGQLEEVMEGGIRARPPAAR